MVGTLASNDLNCSAFSIKLKHDALTGVHSRYFPVFDCPCSGYFLVFDYHCSLRIQYRNSPNSMAVDITCYTADSYCIRDAAAAGATRVAKYSPIHLLGKILELIANRFVVQLPRVLFGIFLSKMINCNGMRHFPSVFMFKIELITWVLGTG